MNIRIGSQITIEKPSDNVKRWCKEELSIVNPDFIKKERMGFWTGNTPKMLSLYTVKGDSVVVPYGCLKEVSKITGTAKWTPEFKEKQSVDYGDAFVPLFDYQKEAVKELISAYYGILQSPAGSGKTQMGIALAVMCKYRTLWLTHTKDLLTQSLSRAQEYIDPAKLGTITEGKVHIGECMTFATIQTMSKLDLTLYKDEWDLIIVDECHRVAGTPTAVTQFSKVLNGLRARHKYGLSATVHRADGLIKATYSLLGPIVYQVSTEEVADRVMRVDVVPVGTGIGMSRTYLNSDGTINYIKMINFLAGCEERNEIISDDLVINKDHYNLILSERVEHLETLYQSLPPYLQKQASVIHGKMTTKSAKAEREQAIEDMRTGDKRYLFATYQLAKEGLDIPRLDRLYLATPQKDYAVITQSVGRVARVCAGKGQPVVYDYVDSTRGLLKAYKRRCTTYRKLGCRIREE